MSRKAVLEGGKRDEIIYVAMQLFFENGYEATSVRMILDKVNGEVGMFYHHFKSKEELFQKVVERFFEDYTKQFVQIAEECSYKEQFIEYLLELFKSSMKKFDKLSKICIGQFNMPWQLGQ